MSVLYAYGDSTLILEEMSDQTVKIYDQCYDEAMKAHNGEPFALGRLLHTVESKEDAIEWIRTNFEFDSIN